MEKYVIRLASGMYFNGFVAGYPTGIADPAKAKIYPSRLGALGGAAAGPAAFFDHAAIVPYSPQLSAAPVIEGNPSTEEA